MLKWEQTTCPLFEIRAVYRGSTFILFSSYGGGYQINVNNADGRSYSLGYSFKTLAAAKGQATKHARSLP